MQILIMFITVMSLGFNSHSITINDYKAKEKCSLDTYIASYHFLGDIKDRNFDMEQEYLRTHLTIHIDEEGSVSQIVARGGASEALVLESYRMLKSAHFTDKECYVKMGWRYEQPW